MHRREFLSICAVFLAGCGGAAQTQSPTQSPVPTESPTSSPTSSPTRSPTESPTESPTPSPTDSPTPTESPTPSPTESPTPTDTPTPTPHPREGIDIDTWTEDNGHRIFADILNENWYVVDVTVKGWWEFTDGSEDSSTSTYSISGRTNSQVAFETSVETAVDEWGVELVEAKRA